MRTVHRHTSALPGRLQATTGFPFDWSTRAGLKVKVRNSDPVRVSAGYAVPRRTLMNIPLSPRSLHAITGASVASSSMTRLR